MLNLEGKWGSLTAPAEQGTCSSSGVWVSPTQQNLHLPPEKKFLHSFREKELDLFGAVAWDFVLHLGVTRLDFSWHESSQSKFTEQEWEVVQNFNEEELPVAARPSVSFVCGKVLEHVSCKEAPRCVARELCIPIPCGLAQNQKGGLNARLLHLDFWSWCSGSVSRYS